MFYNQDAAGTASALYYFEESGAIYDQTGQIREVGGNVYRDSNGFYSFSPGQIGSPCTDVQCDIDLDSSLIPSGSTEVALSHDHPLAGQGGETFSFRDMQTMANSNPVPFGYLSTIPFGRIVLFDPVILQGVTASSGNPGEPCVLQGPLLGMPSCH
jgi:hypothetical protein